MHFLGLVGEGREGGSSFWNKTRKVDAQRGWLNGFFSHHALREKGKLSFSNLAPRGSHRVGSQTLMFNLVPGTLINMLAGLGWALGRTQFSGKETES